MPKLGVSTCIWLPIEEPPTRQEAILVAIDLQGTVIAMPGRLDRQGTPVATSCTDPALAWAYYPTPALNRRREPPSAGSRTTASRRIRLTIPPSTKN